MAISYQQEISGNHNLQKNDYEQNSIYMFSLSLKISREKKKTT